MTHRSLQIAGIVLFLGVVPAVMAIEKLVYTVETSVGDVEIRNYPAHTLATMAVAEDFETAGSTGFRPLFTYITGRNNSGTEIAMTAPVLQAPGEEGWRVSFVMPSEYDRNSLPVPSDARIRIVRVASERLAAISYSGNWSRERFKMFETRLTEVLAASDWQICGPARWARYDPPFMPAFMRHNEVLVPVGTHCE
jgi:SOUL heme-binding protein